MEKITRNNLILAGVLSVCGILMLISPWLAWTSYKVMYPAGLFKSFSLIPSPLADAPWLFYDLIPILSWLPIFGAILIFAGIISLFLELSWYKSLINFGFALGIIMFCIFVGFIFLFVIAEIVGLDLSIIGIPIVIRADFTQPPSLNEVGGWVLLGSCIATYSCKRMLKMPEYEEYLEEFVGLKQEEMKIHEKIVKGTRKCPKCGNNVAAEQLFCSQCGHFF